MHTFVEFVPRLAIAVLLSVQNMITIIVKNALNPVFVVQNHAVKWQLPNKL